MHTATGQFVIDVQNGMFDSHEFVGLPEDLLDPFKDRITRAREAGVGIIYFQRCGRTRRISKNLGPSGLSRESINGRPPCA